MRAKKLRNSLIASAVLLALAGTKPLIAATYVWTGGGNDPTWNYSSSVWTYSNWGNSTTLPGYTDDVVFGNGFASGMPNLSNAYFNSLTIDTSAPIELNGSGLMLASGNLTRTTASSGTQTLNLPGLYLGGNATWDLQGSGGVSVTSWISADSGQSFTKTGSADLTLNSGFLSNGTVTVAGGNMILNGGQSFSDFQGGAALLITSQGSSLLIDNAASLSTTSQPTIDNGGAVTVTGAGTSWSNNDNGPLQAMLVGRNGAGFLTISNGAVVTTSDLVLGAQISGSGTVNVSGGGQLNAINVSAGDVGGGAASIVVTGKGSVLNAFNLTLGTGAPASLLIASGGAVNVTPSSFYPSTPTSLNVGSGAVITVDGGSLTATNITGQGQINLKSDPIGSSALTLGFEQSPVTIQTSISGAGSVTIRQGAQFINCNNTYTGQTFINSGEVDYDGGSSASSFSIGEGYLYLNDGAVLNLGSGSITGTRYAWIVYSDATINGGTISGPATQTVKKATFNGTTIASDAGMVALGYQPFTLNNVELSGRLISNGNLAMNGTAITSTGSVRTAGSVISTGLQSNGMLSISNGTLSNSGTDLQLGAGSQTVISSGAAINLNDGTAISAHSASLINDGIIEGPTNIYSGSVAGGSGQYTGSLNVFAGGRVWPGDGASSSAPIASLASTSSAWNDGGIFHWEISASAGTPGVAWNLWNAGTTSITPTGIFDVEIESVGSLPDWDASTSHSWLIATSDNGAFTPDALSHLAIIDDGFASANDLAGGRLSLTDSPDGSDLYLNFTPAPEPGAMACLTLCASGVLLRRRRVPV